MNDQSLRLFIEEQFAKQATLLQDVHTLLQSTAKSVSQLKHPQEDFADPWHEAEEDDKENQPHISHSWDSILASQTLTPHKQKAIAAHKDLETLQLATTQSEAELDERDARSLARRVVKSMIFSNGIQLLILANLILLGLEVDLSAQLPAGEKLQAFEVANNIIVGLFVMEVLLKWLAYGCSDYFCGRERLWNLFDLVIVGMSVLETIMEVLAKVISAGEMNSSHLRVMRFARLARALRGVRVIRLLRYVSSLRTIVFSIVSTMSSLLWTLVLLVMLFYCFGVFLTQLVTDHCRYEDEAGNAPECPELLLRFWASVPESMLTLFLAISGGLSWVDALQPLRSINPLAVVSLVVYITITIFAVLNVVTGVFCNTAIESARADKDIAIMKQMHKHEAQVQSLREVFLEIDGEGHNVVSLKQLKEALTSKKLASFMHSMDISTQDIWTLFMVIDANGDGAISLDEFVFGCMQLQGPAKGLQMARMSYENTVMREEIKHLQHDLRSMKAVLTKHRRVSSLEPMKVFSEESRFYM